MIKLGVNVDHVATLRQARGTMYPDPVVAALLAEYAGADSVVVHLREDRRHIKERDVLLIKKALQVPLNLEMSVNRDIVAFACGLGLHQATLVPERRQELTTEGGIDLLVNYKKVSRAIKKLKEAKVRVSLFIDPVKRQVKAAKDLGADNIEFNTGKFSEAKTRLASEGQIEKIRKASVFAESLGFFVAAGHGIDYENIKKIIKVREIKELNIGHSIISRAVFIGLVSAIEEMKTFLKEK